VSLDGLTGASELQSDAATDADPGPSGDGATDAPRGSSGGDAAANDTGESPTVVDAAASDAPQAGEDGPAEDSGGSNDSGATDTDTGSTGMGPKDAGSKDTGSTGGPDASPPVGFCAGLGSAALFCDDFDEGTSLAAPWDQLANTGGSETVSGASYVSAPDSMRVTVAPNTPVSSIDLAGYKSFQAKQGVAGTPSLTFQIRIDAADTSSGSDGILGAIQLWNGSAYYDLELEVFYVSASNDFQVSMSEYGSTSTYVKHVVGPHIPFSTWTKVAIGVTLPAAGDGSAPATLAINGANVASVTAHVTTSNPIPEILVGTTFATPTAGGWSIAYDNVTFEEP
jgi:hypothetical protein